MKKKGKYDSLKADSLIRSLMDIFCDYPHQNSYIYLGKKKYLKKRVSDYKILNKEFRILRFLEGDPAVPSVENLEHQYFYEEFIEGRILSPCDLNEPETIIEIANILQRIHSLRVPSNLGSLVKNAFLKKGRYSFSSIGSEVLKHCPPKAISGCHVELRRVFERFDASLKDHPLPVGLIHGDLSFNNFLYKNGMISLIDWTDCRLDTHTCDVSQLFYLMSFTPAQKKIFIDNYKYGFIDSAMMKGHEMLLLLYDLASFYKKRGRVDMRKVEAVEDLLKTIYDV